MSEENINALGSLFSKPDVRDYVAKSNMGADEFPASFKLSYLPAVKNQGAVGSCVAHAIASVAEWYNRHETKKFVKMSTGYIYGNRMLTLHKGSGMYTRDAIKTMTKYGDVPNEYFPHNVEVPSATELFEKEVADIESVGYNYKFKSYYKLKDTNAIKAHLMSNNPVIFSMYWFDDIKIVDGVMQTKCVKTAKTGGHCMVIYGWNEKGWIVQNSWGTTWGNKGRFILPYDVSTKEMWGVTDAEPGDTVTIKKPYSTSVGRIFASVLNKVISWFYNLKYKDEV